MDRIGRRATDLAKAVVLAGWLFPATAHSQARVTVDPHKLAGARLYILKDAHVAQVQATAAPVDLRSSQYVAIRTPGPTGRNTASDGTIRWVTQLRVVGATPAGDSVSVHAEILLANAGLRFQAATRDFSGDLLVGLVDEVTPGGSRALGRSFEMQLIGAVDGFAPDHFVLDHTNQPFTKIAVRARTPPDSIKISLLPSFDPTPLDLWVPVQRPALSLRATPPRIMGFGLEAADLTVQAPPGVTESPVVVALSSEPHGRPDPEQVTLPVTGPGVSSIRSSSLGRTIVRAEALPLQPATAVIEFVWPWGFLIAAVLGGLLGAVVREGHGKVSKQQSVAPIRARSSAFSWASSRPRRTPSASTCSRSSRWRTAGKRWCSCYRRSAPSGGQPFSGSWCRGGGVTAPCLPPDPSTARRP
jgi:hypothetical protein